MDETAFETDDIEARTAVADHVLHEMANFYLVKIIKEFKNHMTSDENNNNASKMVEVFKEPAHGHDENCLLSFQIKR